MPGPWSLTKMRQPSESGSATMRTSPRSLYLSALPSRFCSASRTSARSLCPAAPAGTALTSERWRQNGARVTQDSGGRIYVTAKQRQFAKDNFTQLDHKIVITRYSRDGTPDAAFGGGGYKLLDRNPQNAGMFESFEVYTFVDANNRTHVLDGNLLWRLTPGGRVDMTLSRTA